jgi:hypothetical protein
LERTVRTLRGASGLGKDPRMRQPGNHFSSISAIDSDRLVQLGNLIPQFLAHGAVTFEQEGPAPVQEADDLSYIS